MIMLVACTVFSCSKSGNSPDPPEPPIQLPQKAELLLPVKDDVCLIGEIESVEQSNVLFDWKDAKHSDRYELTLKNLTNGETTKHIAARSELKLPVKRETPYSWWVASLSSSTSQTAQSDVWKFYVTGEVKEYYAPFPADIIYPKQDQQIAVINGKVKLAWTGSDLDNDIKSYEVYFGSETSPLLITTLPAETSNYEMDVSVNNTYYWKIVTIDSAGNKSESPLVNFETN